MDIPKFCGTSHAAKTLALSVGTIHTLVEQNVLKAWKTQGGHRRISVQSLVDYQKNRGLQTFEATKDPSALLKIFLVECGQETCQHIQTLAEDARLVIDWFCFDSALKALVNLESIEPDVLIADVSMPTVDGLELLRTVRASLPANRLSLVALVPSLAPEAAPIADLPESTVLVEKPIHPQWFAGYFAAQIASRKVPVTTSLPA